MRRSHAIARPLHHDERDFLEPFEGREAPVAAQALAPAADGRPIVGDARIDDLVVEVAAGRAPHRPAR